MFGTYNILFGGVGGQGILKASEVCGCAAMLAGFHVKASEVHRMARRGGSVESHLRFGKKIYSPIIPRGHADYLVCFHEAEHRKLKVFLRPGGTDLIGYLKKSEPHIKNSIYLNTFLVGILAAKLDIIDSSCWMKAIEKVFVEKYVEQNKRAFRVGQGIGRK